MLWLSLFAAVIFGTIFGGWRSLRLAREGELGQAHRALHLAALVAGVCGALLPLPTLGWPWSAVTVSVSEEVEKTVTETVDVPVIVRHWYWLYLAEQQIEHQERQKTVTEKVPRYETRQQFRWFLLVLMVGIGILCYYAEKCFVSLAWRFVG
jgi:hypothetical protein